MIRRALSYLLVLGAIAALLTVIGCSVVASLLLAGADALTPSVPAIRAARDYLNGIRRDIEAQA